MRFKYLGLTIIFFLAVAAVFLVNAAGSAPQRSVSPAEDLPEVQSRTMEPAEFIAEPTRQEVMLDAEPQKEVPQAASQPEGLLVFEKRCTRCHMLKPLQDARKSRAEWDKALAQMEELGVSLSGDERTLLLDFLSALGEP